MSIIFNYNNHFMAASNRAAILFLIKLKLSASDILCNKSKFKDLTKTISPQHDVRRAICRLAQISA